MSPSSQVRSFAIILAIAVTILGQQASGFTISRTDKTLTTIPSIDLSLEKVKENLKRQNDNKTTENGISNETTTIDYINEFTTVTNGIAKELYITTETSPSLALTTKEIRSTTEDTRIPTISSDTVEVFDSVEDVTKRNNSKETTSNGDRSSIQHTEFNLNQPVNASETNLTTEFTMFTDQITTESDVTGDRSKYQIVTDSISEKIETTELYNVFEIAPTESVETSTMNTVTDINGTSTVTSPLTTDLSQTAYETSSSNIPSEDSITPTELLSTLFVTNMTQTATDVSDTKVTEPFLEKYTKYTTIVRKRVTSSEDTQTVRLEDDTMQAETSNDVVNFEKAFNVTPITSLEKLRVNLLSYTNGPPLKDEVVSTEVATPTVPTTQTMKPPFYKITEKVETKRAGFLDNSEKATTAYDTSVTSKINIQNNTEEPANLDGRESTDIGNTNFKKVSVSESQSQLAEDAIQEELLKEEAMNNHEENVKKSQDGRNENDGLKVLAEDAPSPVASLPTEIEDSLSVQPINHESTKTTLYTLSPNYKPMKKLDVQPAKPFLRDPDDNSWRNESISSLGIVFKPKNSSKSFKEVLKNKTQSEFNNLQEKDTKDDVPDLRVRLEKIAEVRKTKKKKMNKNGEEVYTDYEEGNSGETNNTTKPDFPSVLSPAEISKHMNPFISKTNLDQTTPMSIFDNVDINMPKTMSTEALFKNLGLEPLTTEKPKNFFNIAEYYDTTDEYDADYVTMSQLDLKKFTAAPETTKTFVRYSAGPIKTRPTQPNFPERKPTVQYFPPREPQKVNVNNLDADFEKKVNLFTFKDSPAQRTPFVTVPPVPIATEKPESKMRPISRLGLEPGIRPEFRPDIRPTVKPTDFTKYTQVQINKNYYLTNAPRITETPEAYVLNDGNLNRGSYVIKHYKDFLTAAVKDNDDERSADFLPYLTQEQQPREVTSSVTERGKLTSKGKDDDYDYDLQFRKEVLSRFVDNFNQNSERFKVDFPILYNSSIVHRKGDESGRALASSQAFLKRLYNNDGMATKNSLLKKPCEPNCDMTVELSPAYELHYYVPEQEEKEEPALQPATMPHRYRL